MSTILSLRVIARQRQMLVQRAEVLDDVEAAAEQQDDEIKQMREHMLDQQHQIEALKKQLDTLNRPQQMWL